MADETNESPKADEATAAEPKAKKSRGRAAAEPKSAAGGSLTLKTFNVCIPADKMAPNFNVEALTAGDAKDVYMKQAGIIATEHAISAYEVIPSGDEE